jgi:hypothetical protein
MATANPNDPIFNQFQMEYEANIIFTFVVQRITWGEATDRLPHDGVLCPHNIVLFGSLSSETPSRPFPSSCQ